MPIRDLTTSATMMQILLRLRCQSCGSGVASAAMTNDLPGWRGRVVRIWGPGSDAGVEFIAENAARQGAGCKGRKNE